MSAPATETREAPDEHIRNHRPPRSPIGKWPGSNFGKQAQVAKAIYAHHPPGILVRLIPFFALGSDVGYFPPVKFEHAGDKDGRAIRFMKTAVEQGDKLRALIDGTPYADSEIRRSRDNPFKSEIAGAMRELIRSGYKGKDLHQFAEAAVLGALGERRYRLMEALQFYILNMGGREDAMRKETVPSPRVVKLNDGGGHNPAKNFHESARITDAANRFKYTTFYEDIDFRELLKDKKYRGPDVFWYLDPPWIWREGATIYRSKRLYKHEMNTWPEHMRFLKFVLDNMGEAKVMILGVRSRLYRAMLERKGWQCVEIKGLAQHSKGEKYDLCVFKNPACVKACEDAKSNQPELFA